MMDDPQDPPRRKTPDEIWAETMGGGASARPSPDEIWAQTVGAAQVDPYKPTTPRIASDRTVTAVKAPEGYASQQGAGAVRALAQGLTFGFADEGEAALRSALGPRKYKEIRDQIRASNEAYARENPLTSAGLNLAGGLASGGVASKVLPALSGTATMAQRIAHAGAGGALLGGATGAGAAKELSDVPADVLLGALGGAAGGTVIGAGLETLRGVRNVIGNARVNGAPPGPIRQAIAADTPEQWAGRKALERIGRTGRTIEDVARDEATAQAPDIFGEVVGGRALRDVRAARGLGHTVGEDIETALTARARDEVGRVKGALSREIGPQVDNEQFIADKVKEAREKAGPIYDQALSGATVTDPRLADIVGTPSGGKAYDATRSGYADRYQDLPSRASLVNKMVPTIPETEATVIPGKPPKVDPEQMLTMEPKELNKARRRTGSLDKLTDDELALEHHYLTRQQAADMASSGDRESVGMAEYRALRSVGNNEDARGQLESMGIDPATYAQRAMRAAKAESSLPDRAKKIAAVEAEMARRQGIGAPPPDAEMGFGDRTVPGRGDVQVPAPEHAPSVPSLPAKAVQRLKLELDDRIAQLDGMPGGAGSTHRRELIQLRDDAENLLHEHANADENGNNLFTRAQAVFAKPMREADAFALGQKSGRTLEAPDVPRLLDGAEAPFVARGVGNTIHEDLAHLGDGAVGQVRNPAPVVMGSNRARARLEVATQGDLNKIARIEDVAAGADRRLRTKNFVLGGSQTAEKLADQAEFSPMGGDLVHAMHRPKSALFRWAGEKADDVGRAALGTQMDALGRLYLAGAPGQMLRADAVAQLRALLPSIQKLVNRQVLTRSALSGAAAQYARDP